MSVFLVRVQGPGQDDEVCDRSDFQVPLTLPAILGRGSLLKCGEKKLSRRHACLDWDDDDLLLTSTHQNPTYVVVGGEQKQLTNGSSVQLSHGDKFGLMENGFWFMINMSSIKEEKEKVLSSTPPCEDTSNVDSKEELVKDSENCPDGAMKNSAKEEGHKVANVNEKREENEIKENGEDKENKEVKTDPKPSKCADSVEEEDLEVAKSQKQLAQDIQSAVLPRKRDLPSWLKNTSPIKSKELENTQKTFTKHTHGGDRKPSTKRKRPENKETTPTKAKNQIGSEDEETPPKKMKSPAKAKQAKHHNLSDENDSDEEVTPKRKKPNQTTPRKIAKQSPSPRKSPNANRSPQKNGGRRMHQMSDESDDSEEETQASGTGSTNIAAKPAKPRKAPAKETESNNEAEGTPSSGETTTTPSPYKRKKRARKSCQYGGSCYRKNPDHKKEFAHVGDSDYQEEESESEDPDDDRPQCEFGIDCYRTNKKHRKEYRHSRVPQPKRRVKQKAQKKKKTDDDKDSEDEYDYEDPFLNDESSDDYAPTDSDSDSPLEDAEEEDNTNRMLKEAKKFIRKRR